MRFFLFILFFVSLASNAQDLKDIRSKYPQAVESFEITKVLDKKLTAVTPSGNPVLLAYKGAILTLKAKFSKSRKEKKDFFKEGVSLIESAVKAAPEDIEIRYIRLSVQENSPKFLGYYKHIEEDKGFVLKHLATVSSKDLKVLINDFIQNSKIFEIEEKQSAQ